MVHDEVDAGTNLYYGNLYQATNFINAFAQAKLKQAVYLHPPSKYFDTSWGENTSLWLNKRLYGKSEAPRLWSGCYI